MKKQLKKRKTAKANVLFARLTDENSKYVSKTAKQLQLTKTQFINYHIAYLRNGSAQSKLLANFAKTRNKIQKSLSKAA